MSDKEPLDVNPIEMTDDMMQEMFEAIAYDPEFRPWKGEVDQFFDSRIWKVIEKAAQMRLANLYRNAAKPGIDPILHARITGAIYNAEWWLNLRDNVFAARERATSLDAQQAGGEPWQAPH